MNRVYSSVVVERIPLIAGAMQVTTEVVCYEYIFTKMSTIFLIISGIKWRLFINIKHAAMLSVIYGKSNNMKLYATTRDSLNICIHLKVIKLLYICIYYFYENQSHH